MVAPSLISPNVGNYYQGAGIVGIKLLGESDYVDAGNAPMFEFLAKVTQLDHFSSRTPVKTKDFTAPKELSGTLTIQLDEFTPRNLGLALLGKLTMPGGSPDAENISIDVFANPVIQGAIRFVGTNDIGAQITVVFPLVQFTPQKALQLIGTGWGVVDLSGDVLADSVTGSFGTATVTGIPTSPNDLV